MMFCYMCYQMHTRKRYLQYKVTTEGLLTLEVAPVNVMRKTKSKRTSVNEEDLVEADDHIGDSMIANEIQAPYDYGFMI